MMQLKRAEISHITDVFANKLFSDCICPNAPLILAYFFGQI